MSRGSYDTWDPEVGHLSRGERPRSSQKNAKNGAPAQPLSLASLPLLCRSGRALAKVLAHFVDLERRFTRVVLGLLA